MIIQSSFFHVYAGGNIHQISNIFWLVADLLDLLCGYKSYIWGKTLFTKTRYLEKFSIICSRSLLEDSLDKPNAYFQCLAIQSQMFESVQVKHTDEFWRWEVLGPKVAGGVFEWQQRWRYWMFYKSQQTSTQPATVADFFICLE